MIPVRVKAQMQRGRADLPVYDTFVVACPDIKGHIGVLVAFLDSNGDLIIKQTAELRMLQFVTPSLDEKGAFQTVSVKRRRPPSSIAADPASEPVGTYSSTWLRATFSSALGLPTSKKKNTKEKSEEDQESVEIPETPPGKRATRSSLSLAAAKTVVVDLVAGANAVGATDGTPVKDNTKKGGMSIDTDGTGGGDKGNGNGKQGKGKGNGAKRPRLGDGPDPLLEVADSDTPGQSLLIAMKALQKESEARLRSEFEQKTKILENKNQTTEDLLRDANLRLDEERRLRKEDAERSKKRFAELATKNKKSRSGRGPLTDEKSSSNEPDDSEVEIPPKETPQPLKKGQKRKHQSSSSEDLECTLTLE